VDHVLSRRVARRAVITGFACAAVLALVYVMAVRTHTGQRFEDAVLQSAESRRQPVIIGALDTITVWSLAAAVLVVAGIGRLRGRPSLGLAGAGVIVASVVTTEFLRAVLPRPLLLEHGYRREDHSFPSGHTAIAMSVMCALVMVVPYRLRGVTLFLTSLWAVGVGALTVTASWHRPSDTIGSDLIVLIYVCAAIALLARYGSVREAEPRTAAGRATMGLLVGPALDRDVWRLSVSVRRSDTGCYVSWQPRRIPRMWWTEPRWRRVGPRP
jgi:PAP2 superfamily.